eukprot:7691731-Alexandrium_andersonii.AAC.1
MQQDDYSTKWSAVCHAAQRHRREGSYPCTGNSMRLSATGRSAHVQKRASSRNGPCSAFFCLLAPSQAGCVAGERACQE